MKKAAGGMGCCKDEQKIIKTDKSQKVTDLVSSDKEYKKFDKSPEIYYEISVDISQLSTFIYYPSHGPPPGESPVSLYLMNCTFLI
jgi:hypothetical protein